MRVLWAINVMPPSIMEEFGLMPGHAISWVDAMSKEIKTSVDLALAAPASVDELNKKEIESIIYYLYPNGIRSGDWWRLIIDEFRPDLIHVYGTEQTENYILVTSYSDYPVLLSLQGLLGEYQRFYYCGISQKEITENQSYRERLKGNSIKRGQISFCERAKAEAKMIKSVRYIEGRSLWDKESVQKINSNIDYYYCPRMIRKAFFDYNWDGDNYEKHSIFVHQGTYPVKGLHILLDALNIVKKSYPEIKLYIAGNEIKRLGRFNGLLRGDSYRRLLVSKIEKYDLTNNIIYLGRMNAEQVADRLSKVNICINCSSIENVPNSVVEAMIVGTPIIASCVGGTTETLNWGECGYLYSYDDYTMLAALIKHVFEDIKEAKQKAKKAMVLSRKRHDPDLLRNRLLSIYNDVLRKEHIHNV